MKKGRPTLFKTAFCESVKKDMAQGYTLAAWAGSVGITRETVYEWCESKSDFSYAVKIGRNLRQRYWEKRLKAAAGNGANSAVIFALKNCCREDWQDKPETIVTVNNIVDPKLIAAAQEVAKKL